MLVACPVCWHSVITPVVCQSCGTVQCLEYEGPRCVTCGGACKLDKPSPAQDTAEAVSDEQAVARDA